MPRVLLIDDEPIYYKMIVHALKPLGYEIEYARTGMNGLSAIPIFNPDVVITDVRMPDLTGYEVAQRLRRDPRYSNIPIIFLTSQVDLDDKLKAFEAGADDYLAKPFQPEELVARVGVLARRSEVLKAAQVMELAATEQAEVISVHSLRGGVGCTSVAVNLAVALHEIWQKPTLIIDTVLNASQVALMLNSAPRHTWADLSEYKSYEVDGDLMSTIINKHSSGLDFIAGPTYPIATDTFSDDFWEVALEKLRPSYEFIVIDTPHDFSNIAIQMLDQSDFIFLMLAPEMASIRATVSAQNIYEKLGYGQQKVKLVLNTTFAAPGLKINQIEKALKRTVDYVVPFSEEGPVRAINLGKPFISANPDEPISTIIEDTAYELSKDVLKNIPPAAPTVAWRRINNRITNKRGRNS
jgi:pilus assembly protein CpaE